ncbi:hypothetical protein Atai01_60680 [Amycolatopsis taiwanensis]|uniref:Uncharacterized protein n=1 Tax=Amycolatopsis taiwanensis TaxID=342230 RepID=A0A9W6R5G4_9PSEU|nr:hypothetical protein Atai01_60680 [Amycolatopsis taiwanensis]
MSSRVSHRGSQTDHSARRRQAPLSGRQGAKVKDLTRGCQERPVDTIKGVWGLAPSRGVGAEPPQDTVARELAEEGA